VILGLTNSFAQENTIVDSTFVNNWSIEFNAGRNIPLEPFGDGFVSNIGLKKTAFKDFNLFRLGTRYMFNSNIGLNLNFYHEGIKGHNKDNNIKFNNTQYGVNLGIVLGLGRFINLEKIVPNFNVHTHSGVMLSRFKIDSDFESLTEDNFGYNLGITPFYRLNDYMSIKTDFSFVHYLSQNRTWDGVTVNNGLESRSFNYSFGMIFYLDNNRKHADWFVLEKKDLMDNKMSSIENRISEIEIMMNDVDKDGVVDYLDFENNTPGGVQVDTRGRFIDVNKNGVPDDMEKRKLVNNSDVGYQFDNDVFLNLLNQGLINIFYDLNEYEPNVSSVNNVYVLLKYLQTNNEVKIKLVGFTDSSGTKEFNDTLSEKRVLYLRNFLTQKGINNNRILTEPLGVDIEVYSDNKYSRRVSVYLVN
jgi:OOP family OmpA-OmpF porin